MAKKIKIFFISVLALLVVGMTLIGVLGFNQNVDNRGSYEMQISVNFDAQDSATVLKDASEKALKDNGLNPVAVQIADDGTLIIYKFNKDVSAYATKIENSVKNEIDKLGVTDLEATNSVKVVVGGYYSQVGKVLLALGIALAVVFLYALVVVKLSGGVAVLSSTVLSALLATALLGITRIPAGAYLAIFIAIAMAIGGGLALFLATKYKAGLKTAEKVSTCQVAEKVHADMLKVYIALAGTLVVATLLSLICGLGVFMIALGVCLSAITGIVCAMSLTPIVWSAIKGKKKK